MGGDELYNIGEVFVRPPKIPLVAGDVRFHQPDQREHRQTFDLFDRFPSRAAGSGNDPSLPLPALSPVRTNCTGIPEGL
jgi:hypothetical protein